MKRYCRNCFHPLPARAKFCPNCGQKDSDGKVKMSTMLRKLWDATFHLEGKFIRSCWQLFVPGKMPLEFFKGKQDRYPHPLRMFAIVMFLFLFFVNQLLKKREEHGGTLFRSETSIKTPEGDSVVMRNKISFYESLQQTVLLNDIRLDYDSLPAAWKTETARKVVDSLLTKFNQRIGNDEPGLIDSLVTETDSMGIGLWGDLRLQLSIRDIVRFTPDELLEKYGIHDWKLRLIVRQTLKSYKNPEGFVHSYIGSLTWAILALVALMSGVLSLLYWRQKRYYVEHFIFLLHYHTGLMLALLLAILGVQAGLWSLWVFLYVFLAATVFFYVAMRRYYGQTRGKTLLKWVIFGVLYYFSFLILFILGSIVVFALF